MVWLLVVGDGLATGGWGWSGYWWLGTVWLLVVGDGLATGGWG